MKTLRLVLVFCGMLLFILAGNSVSAEVVSQEKAGEAVRNWLSLTPTLGCPMGATVQTVRTCVMTNGLACHVVRLAEGGFVVTSADTRFEPIIAFSDGDDLVENDRNPLWALLKRDLAVRMRATGGGASFQSVVPKTNVMSEAEEKWAKLLAPGARLQSRSSVSDIRVAPLVQSKWDQDECDSGLCYNYYTPNNYPCGCVATGAAQMMRYFQWPKATTSITPYTCQYCMVDDSWRTLTTQGGCYDWSQMPLNPDQSGTTKANRKAIGKLTSDIGIISGMRYTYYGSGVGGYMLQFVFPKFGYSNVMTYLSSSDLSESSAMKNALLSNLDARLPVMVSIQGVDGGHAIGHAIVGDGYGYSGNTLYIHFNFGWSGIGNAWYAPPDLNAGDVDFSVLDGFVYNVYTNQPAGSVICSGRVLTSEGVPVAGATVTATQSGQIFGSATTDTKGIYALYLKSNSYALTATVGTSVARGSISVSACRSMSLCPDTSADYGKYYVNSKPSVGNVWGKDLILSSLPSVEAPVLSPSECRFFPSTNVTLSCATAGATIRYTLDGEDPTESSAVYSGSIALTTTTCLKVQAFKSAYVPSPIVSAVYTYAPPGDYFADPIVISGESGTHVTEDNSRYTLEDNEPLHTLENNAHYVQAKSIWYRWTAPRNGTVSFSTKFQSVVGNRIWHHQSFVAVYSGDSLSSAVRESFATEWDTANDHLTTLTIPVEEGMIYNIVGMIGDDAVSGTFTLIWSGEYECENTATSTTDVPVPHIWLDRYFPGTHSAVDYETIANADQDGDGFPTWQEYVLDTDPTDSTSTFTASIRMEGLTPVVEWSHTNSAIKALGYRYVPKGRTALTSGAWLTPISLNHRFFKVFVEPME